MRIRRGLILVLIILTSLGSVIALNGGDGTSVNDENKNIRHTATPVLSIQSEDNEVHNVSIELRDVSTDQPRTVINTTQELPPDGRISYQRTTDEYYIRVFIDQDLVLNKTAPPNVGFAVEINRNGKIGVSRIVV